MADRRRHRGQHPEDGALFGAESLPALRHAVNDLSWLLTKGYAQPSSIKLVGDRYALTTRQRVAVVRSACSEQARHRRAHSEVLARDITARDLAIDAYNVLTTVEAALAGGVLLVGRDGCLRDMASVHGSWRKVSETLPAIMLSGKTLAAAGVRHVRWLIDSPVSNSARLALMLRHAALHNDWHWTVELVHDADVPLASATEVVASADSVILDRCDQWVNLARYVVRENIPDAWILDFSEITPAAPSIS